MSPPAPASKYEVFPAERYGKGQLGLWATSPIDCGEVIESEAPLLDMRCRTTPAMVARSHQELFSSISSLTKQDFGRFKNLAFRYSKFIPSPEIKEFHELSIPVGNRTEELEHLAIRTFFAYSIPFASEKVEVHRLCSNLCFSNHSCKPNAALYWDAKSGKAVLKAAVGIEKGDEIVVSYLANPLQAKAKRRSGLGFDCQCTICSAFDPICEKVYTQMGNNLDVLTAMHRWLRIDSLPVDLQQADKAQLRAIARKCEAGPKTIQDLVENLRLGADSLGVQHLSLVPVLALSSAVSLAWCFMNPSAVGHDKILHDAVVTRVSEIGILSLSVGFGKQLDRAILQLWWMTQLYPEGEKVFCDLMEESGIPVEIGRGWAEKKKDKWCR